MRRALAVSFVLLLAGLALAQDLAPEEILERVRAAWQPQSFWARVVLSVSEEGRTEEWEFEIWGEDDKALVRVLSPEDEAGGGYLVVGDEVWYYSPKVGFSVQLPELALAESVFGGTAALEDLFRGTLAKECEVSADPWEEGWRLVLVPKPEAPVVWGKLELWVRKDFALSEMRFFDQRGEILRTVRASVFLEAGGLPFPTLIAIEDAHGNQALVQYVDLSLGIDIPDEVFTLEFLEGR
ncbi:outer membrane lipoprotein-sorting protein [Candidatus Bipolaricaulota bacterium]|nr:outer membrane lipoprotein-sorting protein [Candidatus Bipolaricaulota bacterium]